MAVGRSAGGKAALCFGHTTCQQTNLLTSPYSGTSAHKAVAYMCHAVFLVQ